MDEGIAADPPILVSACLLGVRCNHRAAANTDAGVVALGASRRLIAICPEMIGGLPAPRPAAERRSDGTVRTAEGIDVTDAYERGAAAAVALARATGASEAVLKARSPSCGCGRIYDGTFTRTTTAGDGVTAAALRAAGLQVASEEDLT